MTRSPMAFIRQWPTAIGALALLAILFFAELRYPGFSSLRAITGLWTSRAPLILVSVGMTWVVMMGGIDLAVGAVLTVAAMTTAVAVRAGVPIGAAACLGLVLGTAMGAAQGATVQWLRLPAFIVTLAGMFLARGTGMLMSAEPLFVRDPWVARVGSMGFALPDGIDLSAVALVTAGIVVLSILADRYLVGATYLRAIGDHEAAAAVNQVPVARVRVCVYTLSGALAALAGLAAMLYVPTVAHDQALGLELEAVTAVVLGGTPLRGGKGSIVGTLIGVHVVGLGTLLPAYEPGMTPGMVKVVVAMILLAFVLGQRGLTGMTAAGAQRKAPTPHP